MRIIIIDHDTKKAEHIYKIVEKLRPGDEVSSFMTGEAALWYADETKVDVAIINGDFNDMDIVQLCKLLRGYNSAINIILLISKLDTVKKTAMLHPSAYLIKPVTEELIAGELENLRYPVLDLNSGIRAVTFGNFDFLVDGNPVHFSRSRSKELLAYLIDLRGNVCTKKEIASVLLEDQPYDEKTQDLIKKITRALEQDLKSAGAEDVFIRRRDYYAVDRTKFACDLYDFEAGNPAAKAAFHETYMNQYSWGEMTLGTLLDSVYY